MGPLHPGRRVHVQQVARIGRTRGEDAAHWLHGRLGVVMAPGKSEGTLWVRLDDALPPALRGNYPDNHPLGRNILLLTRECQPAHDRGYAPFHQQEFESALDSARLRFDSAFLQPPSDPTRPEWSWWKDVTQERRNQSALGLGEHVYRFGVEQRKVTLLVYSSVSTTTGWSRPSSTDAIRFVHEVRSPEPLYLNTHARVNRTGTLPLSRLAERVVELMAPERVSRLAKASWNQTPFQRR